MSVWMQAPDDGESKEIESPSEELVRLMVAGWVKSNPPKKPARKRGKEVNDEC